MKKVRDEEELAMVKLELVEVVGIEIVRTVVGVLVVNKTAVAVVKAGGTVVEDRTVAMVDEASEAMVVGGTVVVDRAATIVDGTLVMGAMVGGTMVVITGAVSGEKLEAFKRSSLHTEISSLEVFCAKIMMQTVEIKLNTFMMMGE